jgi:hypothetical protein
MRAAPSGPPSDHKGYADADEGRDDDESRKIGAGVSHSQRSAVFAT